jgi:hypothetical protein
VTAAPLPSELGVIEDARKRQRRHRLAALAIFAVLAAIVCRSLLGGGIAPERSGVASSHRLSTAGPVTAACVLTRPSPDLPDRALLGALAVLRRPPAATDQPPRSITAHLFAHSVRLARVVNGSRYFVVPHYWPRCAPQKPIDVVSVYATFTLANGRTAGGGFGALSADELRTGGDFGARTSRTDPASDALFGLVPDGVTKVSLQYPTGPPVIASAINNVVVFTHLPRQATSGPGPAPLFFGGKMTWLAANGHIIKRFPHL